MASFESLSFAIVDVFSKTAYKGNPLSIVDNTTASLSLTQMKLIARQFNLSETTFFSKSENAKIDFSLRSFLPDGKEVFGAGHNILGVWWYLAYAGKLAFNKPIKVHPGGAQEFEFHQDLGGNISTVKIFRKANDGVEAEFAVVLRQAPPQAHNQHPDIMALAESMGLSNTDIGLSSQSSASLIPQVMSTATTRHLMVPLMSVEALNAATVQRDRLLKQLNLVDDRAYGIYLFAKDSTGDKNQYQARFFSPGMSGEDPATGSAAGPLAKYLFENGYLDENHGQGRIKVRQGLNLGRECMIDVILSLQNSGKGQHTEVDIMGSGVQIMSGTMRPPCTATSF
jgi:PhzF family phenazine biosynthesis protein